MQNNTIDAVDLIKNTYKSIYPDRKLKPLQIKILMHLMAGYDVLAILATGFGKSICYQLPYLIYNKCVIVISPLLALMKDQQKALMDLGIPCVCFNSEMSQKDKEYNKLELVVNDNMKIIYMTPEFFIKSEQFIRDLYTAEKLCLFAIDEAHCLSLWGHEFRKDYMSLRYIKQWAPDIPIYACTATATENVEKDITQNLKFNPNKSIVIKSSYARNNLHITCKNKSNDLNDILPYLTKYKNDSSIIYVKTQDDASELANKLISKGFNAEAYHGGLTKKIRIEVQDNFMNSITKCIVATIAFGMGIDQPVHLVIHYGLSNDIESYYQEIGRAGRDGIESECILFWNKKDIVIGRSLLKDIENDKLRKNKETKLRIIENYVTSSKCRKLFILDYFGESSNDICNKCDNCIISNKTNMDKINKKKLLYDPTPLYFPIYMIIKTFMIINKGLGSKKLIDILRGKNTNDNIDFRYINTFGICNNYNIVMLKELIHLLNAKGFLIERLIKKTIMTYNILGPNSIALWKKIGDTIDNNIINNKDYWNTLTDIPETYTNIKKFLINNNTEEARFARLNSFDQILTFENI